MACSRATRRFSASSRVSSAHRRRSSSSAVLSATGSSPCAHADTPRVSWAPPPQNPGSRRGVGDSSHGAGWCLPCSNAPSRGGTGEPASTRARAPLPAVFAASPPSRGHCGGGRGATEVRGRVRPQERKEGAAKTVACGGWQQASCAPQKQACGGPQPPRPRRSDHCPRRVRDAGPGITRSGHRAADGTDLVCGRTSRPEPRRRLRRPAAPATGRSGVSAAADEPAQAAVHGAPAAAADQQSAEPTPLCSSGCAPLAPARSRSWQLRRKQHN